MTAIPSSPPHDRSLLQRIVAVPWSCTQDVAEKRLDDWLIEIGDDAAALQSLFAAHPQLRALILSLADSSPHLWEMARADARRLVALLTSEPEARFETIVAETLQAVAATHDEATVMRLLRRMKADASLLIALADIAGVWPVMRVTEALTALADAAVGAAVGYLLRQASRDGKLRPVDPAEPQTGSGYIVLAMGKMGAGELNYSSDIDLVVFYDADAPAFAAGEPASFYVRMTRGLVKLLQERTGDGYVFRTDLRLRPDPGSTHIAVSTAAALDYYESVGRNWERAAMIKARPCAGDLAAGERLLRELSPFIWRKYLDFAAVADIHGMKRQIHAYRGHGEIAVEGHNVKLGRGGIREIEFFVQTQQLIAGGRYPELRGRETLAMLAALAQGEWISAEARDELSEAYQFLRRLEHRLQMVADEQTHTLPRDHAELARFACFFGFPDSDSFAQALLAHLRNVQRHYAALFESAPAAEARARSLVFPVDADDRETLDNLTVMGFKQPLEASARVRGWFAGGYRSLRGEHAREQLRELVPLLLPQFARSASPDAALLAFDQFLAGLHGAGRLLSLLRQNPDMITLIATVLGSAPRLAESLARFPDVIDAVVDPSFFGALPEEAEFRVGLDRSLAQSSGYEDFLDRIRIFAQEQMFLIGTRILSGTVSAEQASEAFARLADMLIRSLHERVEREFIALHGRIKGQETAIVALGKLGGREMTATSDLDLIVIYDYDEAYPESDGPCPLYGAQYFSRLVQRLISALTAQTNYGVLYQVDMRLRPSGRSGPLATHIDSFANYQDSEAWTWEHMALTRARVVSATPAFRDRIDAVTRSVLSAPRNAVQIAGDAVEMRQAIAREKGDSDRWNLKYVAGGLVDIEFIAQYLQLVHAAQTPDILDPSTSRVLEKAWRLGLLSTEHAEVLRPAVQLYHNLTQVLRLCLPGDFDPKAASPGLCGLLSRAADVPDFATLEAFLIDTETRVRACFNSILGVSA